MWGNPETRSRLVPVHPKSRPLVGVGLAPQVRQTEIFGSFVACPQLIEPCAWDPDWRRHAALELHSTSAVVHETLPKVHAWRAKCGVVFGSRSH